MRLKSVTVQGFRAFGGSAAFDLDAEAVVIVGANGSGKTSIFDAILWALTGKVMRLGGVDAPVLSMWSESGEASVQLVLGGNGGEALEVSRAYDGVRSRMTLTVGEQQVPEALANGTLIQHLWPVGLNNADASEAIAVALTRAVYLQQDNVRDFIDADSDEDRFRAISELIGAGAVTQLQAALERSRNQWTRATTTMNQDLPTQQERVQVLETELERLVSSRPEGEVSERDWREWIAACLDAGVSGREVPAWTSTAAATVADEVMRELGAVQKQLERREVELQSLSAEQSRLTLQPTMDLAELTATVGRLTEQVDASRKDLLLLRQQAAEQARLETLRADHQDDLKRLAAIAIRHLDERCPVCAQEYDHEATRNRLEALISSSQSPPEAGSSAVAVAAQALSALESELAAQQGELEKTTQVNRDWTTRVAYIDKRFADLGFGEGKGLHRGDWLASEFQSAHARLSQIRQLRSVGDRLLLERARLADSSRRSEIEKELERAKAELSGLDVAIAERETTKELATKMIDALRSAGDELVSERLRAIEPLARRIYRRIDPHPAFTNVHLKSWLLRGKGHMAPQLEDPVSQKVTDQPGLVLSSSQANAVAVAIFLAVNLGVGDLPLDAAMLDDPLQSLDDVNLLGLIDLLRRVKKERQLIVSTHDTRFGQLLARKLRPTVPGGRTAVIELRDWRPGGPQILERSVQPTERQFQVVA
ncbi:MAG: repair protein SbcC/Rad50 [Chloroflexota bacterium]|jgi:DNA repair exonuclease SbcCD ATPase subunit|nr:repair protein SbcC/Rad50 [Chloroflexota bacterium]